VVWLGLEKEEDNKKDERGKFIKMDVYAQYCRYTANME
jgi:Xaa-Pro aminopeptidase